MAADEYNEDEEWEPGKTKPSIKGLLKALLVLILVVGGLFILNQFWGNLAISMVGFMLVCSGSFIMGLEPRRRKKTKRVYSIYQCRNGSCGVKELHEFKDGDFIYKYIGPCSKCDEPMEIVQIFAVEVLEKDRIRMEPPRPPGFP